MDWKTQLAQNDPGVWEQSYRTNVLKGPIADEAWAIAWLEQRIALPGKDYSLFNNALPMVEAHWLETRLLIETAYEGKERLVQFQIFGQNPYQPDFHRHLYVEEHEARFHSVGNPFIDEPNYRLWEELLFGKLVQRALYREKGLDFLIDRWRSRL